jgi:hypothetical protein
MKMGEMCSSLAKEAVKPANVATAAQPPLAASSLKVLHTARN